MIFYIFLYLLLNGNIFLIFSVSLTLPSSMYLIAKNLIERSVSEEYTVVVPCVLVILTWLSVWLIFTR